MQRLTNQIRRYAWGSPTAIPELLGVDPDGDPQAELWLGAHPAAPSTLADGTTLDAAVAADPAHLVGQDVRDRFGDRLPYLAKVLAAAEPLSLQVHPTQEQAEAGFAAEEDAGVPRDARHRRYADPHHKPEVIVALTPFHALCGLREPRETCAVLDRLAVGHPAWDDLRDHLAGDDAAAALRATVSWLLGDDPRIGGLVGAVADAARAAGPGDEVAGTVAGLADAYPGDPGVLVALLLHRVTLAPREALYLPAGNVHAYLRGTGIEVMASSDNVLRAGLTGKHVDPDELLRIVDWTPRPVPRVVPQPVAGGAGARYRPGAGEFEVLLVDVVDADAWVDVPVTGPRIVLAVTGRVGVRAGGQAVHVDRGASLFVAAGDGPLSVRGVGTVAVAGVPPAV